MRLKGKKFAPAVEFVVFPRPTSVIDGKEVNNDIVFKCGAVTNFDAFDKLCPEPQVPIKLLAGGIQEPDNDNPGYLEKLNARARKQQAYLFIQSLKATEELEWETVKENDPETWENYRTELEQAGLTLFEIARIMKTVMAANGLDEERLEEAKRRFLLTASVEKA